MQLYHAHPRTGEYVGTSVARPDPRSPDRFLVPAHAYTDAPPSAPAGMVPVWEDGAWTTKAKAPSPQEEERAASISFRQLIIGLTREEWITLEEGRGWLQRNGIPDVAAAMLDDAFPEDPQARFEAETTMLAVDTIHRSHPLVAALAAQQGRSEAEIDGFFETYARV